MSLKSRRRPVTLLIAAHNEDGEVIERDGPSSRSNVGLTAHTCYGPNDAAEPSWHCEDKFLFFHYCTRILKDLCVYEVDFYSRNLMNVFCSTHHSFKAQNSKLLS